jgi:hypothetical protein
MIYAEKRREDGGDDTHYTLRYIVWNGNTVGTYGVHFGRTEFDSVGLGVTPRPQDPEGGGYAYGASRDYHQLATFSQVTAYREQQRYFKLSDAEQDAYDEKYGYPSAQSVTMGGCCYLPDGPSVCDGSGLVEVTLDDRRAFEIAAMMADLENIQPQGD